jgi:hypothetical protein
MPIPITTFTFSSGQIDDNRRKGVGGGGGNYCRRTVAVERRNRLAFRRLC